MVYFYGVVISFSISRKQKAVQRKAIDAVGGVPTALTVTVEGHNNNYTNNKTVP